MNVEIRKYNSANDYEQLVELIRSEGAEWKEYLNPKYGISLEQSITYVAIIGDELCGYSRSLNDPGYYVWVVDLLVHKNRRGHAIGKQLMDCVRHDFPDQEILVMSDVDPYYEKLGYKKEGSVFTVK